MLITINPDNIDLGNTNKMLLETVIYSKLITYINMSCFDLNYQCTPIDYNNISLPYPEPLT